MTSPLASSFQAPRTAHAPTLRQFSGIDRKSVYIPMRDGVRLAATVYTPKGLAEGERTATVLQLTRYYRLISVKPIWRPFWGFKPVAITEKDLRDRFVRAGYSWIDVDVRGTGASFGTWVAPYDPETVRDGAEVLDWIARQPWSSGRVAALGSSYNAALAVLQLSHDHPALKAVVSTFGIWDIADLRPGGLRMTRLVEPLSMFFEAMDRDDIGSLGWMPRLFARGVEPVESALLRQAQQARAGNMNLQRFFADLHFRDDTIHVTASRRPASTDAINPQAVVGRRSGAPVLTFGGWYDNAFAAGALRQFVATRTPGSRVRIGPWTHGVGTDMNNVSPYAERRGQTWDHHGDEVQRFLDRHLRGIDNGIDREPPVQYYVMGEEQWRSADTWPPASGAGRSYYLAESSTLAETPPAVTAGPGGPAGNDASDRYVENFTTSSGGARWGFSLDGKRDRVFVKHDTASSSHQMRYETAPLDAPTTIIGAPLVELFLAADAADALFVYLEDVAPDGRARAITEGQLRLIHRQLTGAVDPSGIEPLYSYRRTDARAMTPDQVERVVLRLLPAAYRIPAGHRIRLSIAGADASSFVVPAAGGWPTYDLHRDAAHPSRISLPIYD